MDKQSKETKYNFPLVEDTLYPDPLTCDSCGKQFCHTIRIEEGERFCKACYNHRFGLEDTLEVSKALDAMANHLWEVPFNELSEEVKSRITFVKKP